jgi:hypothetical protein
VREVFIISRGDWYLAVVGIGPSALGSAVPVLFWTQWLAQAARYNSREQAAARAKMEGGQIRKIIVIAEELREI